MSTEKSEPRCQWCKRTKVLVRYIDSLGQRTQLKLGPVQTIGKAKLQLAETFTEPYPEGNAVTLLACETCDDTPSWPKSSKPKTKRFSL